MSGDAFDRFARELCIFFDSVKDMPKFAKLEFKVEVIKVAENRYHLSNPVLGIAQKGQEIILQ